MNPLPAAVPPDVGLQSERTSLSWARTWAVLTADILLVARLVAETSPRAAGLCAATALVPLGGLVMVRTRHRQRVARFRMAGEVDQANARGNLALAVLVVVMATMGVTAVLVQALR